LAPADPGKPEIFPLIQAAAVIRNTPPLITKEPLADQELKRLSVKKRFHRIHLADRQESVALAYRQALVLTL
jgi:hypothetical protein